MLIRQIASPTLDFVEHFVSPDYLEEIENDFYNPENIIFFLATDEEADEHVGYALFYYVQGMPNVYELLHIRVVYEYRGLGIGEKLMLSGIELIKQQKGKLLGTRVLDEDTEDNLKFLKGCGFMNQREAVTMTYHIENILRPDVQSELKKYLHYAENVKEISTLSRVQIIQLEQRLKEDAKDMEQAEAAFIIEGSEVLGQVTFFRKNIAEVSVRIFLGNDAAKQNARAFVGLVAYSLNYFLKEKDRHQFISFYNLPRNQRDVLEKLLGEPQDIREMQQMSMKL